MIFKWFISKCFQIMYFNVFSKFPIDFNGFQIVCFQNVFQKCFQKSPIGFKVFSKFLIMVFKLCISKCFQIMCFKVFSKISHRFQCFQIVCFKVFSKFLTGFNAFQTVCFIVFSKFLTGFNAFQIVFSKWVSKCFQIMFQNVVKNSP